MMGNPMTSTSFLPSSSERTNPPRGVCSPALSIVGLEQLPVLRLLDRLQLGADQLDVVLLQHPVLRQRNGGVQRRLPSHRGEDRVRTLALDDLFDEIRGDRLDVGPVGQVRIGHDRGRIAVDEDDAVSFLTQHFAGLGPGIIKLAGLTDDDRA